MRKKIFVAGHNGMVGSSICRQLDKNDDFEIITQSHAELNLINQKAVTEFFEKFKINEVILAAAKVGGIHANYTYPAEFIYQNIQIQANVIQAAHLNNVQKLLFLGSSCIYPKAASQPMREDALLSGPLEPTNEPYAIAKIAGIKLCESYNRQYGRDYRSVMPTNLYGPGDNYHPDDSHVVPALIQRLHKAKVEKLPEVFIWGTGNAKREFLYVDDMAEASLHVHWLEKEEYTQLTLPNLSHINVGSGFEITIKELAETIKSIVGFEGNLSFDVSKPDGMVRKLLNSEIINQTGWKAKTSLIEGLKKSYDDFLEKKVEAKV